MRTLHAPIRAGPSLIRQSNSTGPLLTTARSTVCMRRVRRTSPHCHALGSLLRGIATSITDAGRRVLVSSGYGDTGQCALSGASCSSCTGLSALNGCYGLPFKPSHCNTLPTLRLRESSRYVQGQRLALTLSTKRVLRCCTRLTEWLIAFFIGNETVLSTKICTAYANPTTTVMVLQRSRCGLTVG